MRIVEIVWRDHSGSHGWTGKLAAPMTITQAGYLAEEHEDCYVLVDSKVVEPPDGTLPWGCSTAILKSDVTSFREIEAAE